MTALLVLTNILEYSDSTGCACGVGGHTLILFGVLASDILDGQQATLVLDAVRSGQNQAVHLPHKPGRRVPLCRTRYVHRLTGDEVLARWINADFRRVLKI